MKRGRVRDIDADGMYTKCKHGKVASLAQKVHPILAVFCHYEMVIFTLEHSQKCMARLRID